MPGQQMENSVDIQNLVLHEHSQEDLACGMKAWQDEPGWEVFQYKHC